MACRRKRKDNEYRIRIVPSTARELTEKGHRVIIETNDGAAAGLSDGDYAAAGAELVANPEAVYSNAELIVKVKETARARAQATALRSNIVCLLAFVARSRPS